MIGIKIEKRNQFREQSVPILSQIEGQEIETAHKSVVSPCFPFLDVFEPISRHTNCSAEADDIEIFRTELAPLHRLLPKLHETPMTDDRA